MRHRIGTLEIDVEFELTQPWTILFGPSGSGKTTILRAIAGLLHPDHADIFTIARPGTQGERRVRFNDTSAGVLLPSHLRCVPLAPQKSSLFPHLTALENMTYGNPRAGNLAERNDRDEQLKSLPRLFQIDHVLDKRPAQLSGGEAQRVSLARAAMARHKHILLLDEPFTGLDIPLRDGLVASLLAWQARYQTPILSVTHNIAEAFQLNAEVIKLSEGRIVEQGPVAIVLADERARLLRQLNASAG